MCGYFSFQITKRLKFVHSIFKPSKYVHKFLFSMNTIFQKYINFVYLTQFSKNVNDFVYSSYTIFWTMYTIMFIQLT